MSDTTGLTPTQQTELARITALSKADASATPTITPTDTTGTGAFLEQLQSKLLGQADIVSSADTGIDQAISSALEATQASQAAGAQRIETQFGGQITDIREAGATAMTSAREAQRGFGVNRAALKQISDDTASKVKEYQQMKDDALLSNNTAFASQLSNLQLQALQFEQTARQQEFSNLMSIGGFVTQMQQLELQTQQFAKDATQQELDNQFAKEQFEFSKSTSLEEQRQSQIRINIMNEELKIKQLESGGGLIPDPGFVDVPTGNKTGAASNNLLSIIQQQKNAGLITTQEEEEAATIKAYQQIRSELSQSEATNEAIAGKLGMAFDDETGELGFIEGQITEQDVPLPGESSSFTNTFEIFDAIMESTSKSFRSEEVKLIDERKIALKSGNFDRVREIDIELNK